MKARALISGASYGPETLQLIGEAFDKAWAQIAHHFGEDGQVREVARERLAHAILAVADPNARDVEALKVTALQVMALNYGQRIYSRAGQGKPEPSP